MRKGNKTFIIIFLVVVAGIGLLAYRNFGSSGTGKVPCNNPAISDPPNLHWHPELTIIIDGENITIPANIGLELGGCHRVLHTHDVTGQIHVEPDFAQDLTLGDFFGVWEKPLSKTQILDKVADGTHEIVMTVDGAPNTQFENLILKDKQRIVIEYRQASTGK